MIQNLNRKIKHNIIRLIVFVIMGIAALGSAVSVAALSQKVCIKDGENTIVLYAISTDTNRMLNQAGISLGPDDTVERTDNEDSISINVLRAFSVKVTDNNETREVNISKGSVADAVKKSGLVVRNEDIISPESSTAVYEGMEINILRRYSIHLTIGNDTKDLVVPAGTVRKSLEFLGISLGEEDTVSVDLETEVYEDMEINLVRVEYVEIKEKEAIPYSKTATTTDSLYKGEKKTESGEDGVKEVTIQEKKVNGEVVEIKRISEEIVLAPKNEVTYIGVKQKVTTPAPSSSNSISKGYSRNNGNGTFLDHNGKTVAYKSVITGSATAYTSQPGAITSTGKIAGYGKVAVNPGVIPYGSKLYIASKDGSVVYGYAVAEDTGEAMLSGKRLVDLYYDTISECYNFGVQDVNIYFL